MAGKAARYLSGGQKMGPWWPIFVFVRLISWIVPSLTGSRLRTVAVDRPVDLLSRLSYVRS
jgi:hypothetical protein